MTSDGNMQGAGAGGPEQGPSTHAGVPTPALPPLPPGVAQNSPPPAPAAASLATGTLPQPPMQQPPMGPDSFNAKRPSTGGGGFNPRLLGIPVVIVIALVGMWMNRGTTTADDLKAGDCFIMPTSGTEFDRLNTEECSAPHDGQILAEVEVPGPDEYPADSSDYWQTVFNRCIEQADLVLTRNDLIPADTELDFFSPVEQGWERSGDRKSLCYIYSPGGLEGSHVG